MLKEASYIEGKVFETKYNDPERKDQDEGRTIVDNSNKCQGADCIQKWSKKLNRTAGPESRNESDESGKRMQEAADYKDMA